MTQTEERNDTKDLEPDDLTPEEDTLEELVNEEFAGVHVLSQKDTEKHFGPSNKDSDKDRDKREDRS